MDITMERTSENLQIFKGGLLGKTHEVEAFLGEGGFGFVTKCRNIETGKSVAVKVTKNHPEILLQAKKEIAILKRLQCLDSDTCSIVRWNGDFSDSDHICLSFELLDQSLLDYMEGQNKGLPMTELRSVLHQLATALSHLRSMGIIHADLKPENVIVVDQQKKPLKVKLIDFGLAHPVFAAQPGVCLQTTWYRAPEVMLHMPYDEAIDMWSLGLLAVELATGCPLYRGDIDYDVLRFIVETQGQPADYLLDRGMGSEFYFQRQRNSWKFKMPEQFEYETGFSAAETRWTKLKHLDDLQQLLEIKRGHHSDHHLLVNLIKSMLQLNPDKRIKPSEVLQHPFFAPSLPQSPPAHTCKDMTDFEERKTFIAEDIHCKVESTPASLQLDPDQSVKTSEVHPFSGPDLPQSPPAHVCIDMTDFEEQIPEVSQQWSWYQTAEPEDSQCRVESTTASLQLDPDQSVKPSEVQPFSDPSLPQSPPAHVCIDMTDFEEQIPEISQQWSWYQTAEPVDSQCRVESTTASLQLDPDQSIKPLEVHPFSGPGLLQSPPAYVCIDMTDFEEQIPEVSQQWSWYQTAEPVDSQCRVENTTASLQLDPDQSIKPLEVQPFSGTILLQSPPAHVCIDMTDFEEQIPEVSQQWFWYQTAEPEDSQCRVESTTASLQLDPDQSIKPLEVHPFSGTSLPRSPPAHVCIDMTYFEEQIPEVSQQWSWYQTAEPEDSQCRVESTTASLQLDPDQSIKPLEVPPFSGTSLPQSPPAHVCIDTTDFEEQIPEVSQQWSWYQTAEPEDSQCRVESTTASLQLDPDQSIKPLEVHPFSGPGLPQSPPAYVCIDMIDFEDEIPEVSQQWSWYQTAEPVDSQCRVESTTASLQLDPDQSIKPLEVHPLSAPSLPQSPPAHVCIDMTDFEEQIPEVGQQQVETNAENVGCFGRFIGRLAGAFCS